MSSTSAHYSESSGFRHVFFRLGNARFSPRIISSSIVSNSLFLFDSISLFLAIHRDNTTYQKLKKKIIIINKGLPMTCPCRHREELEVGLQPLASIHPQPATRRMWLVSTTPRQIYAIERTGTHCTAGWVSLRPI